MKITYSIIVTEDYVTIFLCGQFKSQIYFIWTTGKLFHFDKPWKAPEKAHGYAVLFLEIKMYKW